MIYSLCFIRAIANGPRIKMANIHFSKMTTLIKAYSIFRSNIPSLLPKYTSSKKYTRFNGNECRPTPPATFECNCLYIRQIEVSILGCLQVANSGCITIMDYFSSRMAKGSTSIQDFRLIEHSQKTFIK